MIDPTRNDNSLPPVLFPPGKKRALEISASLTEADAAAAAAQLRALEQGAQGSASAAPATRWRRSVEAAEALLRTLQLGWSRLAGRDRELAAQELMKRVQAQLWKMREVATLAQVHAPGADAFSLLLATELVEFDGSARRLVRYAASQLRSAEAVDAFALLGRSYERNLISFLKSTALWVPEVKAALESNGLEGAHSAINFKLNWLQCVGYSPSGEYAELINGMSDLMADLVLFADGPKRALDASWRAAIEQGAGVLHDAASIFCSLEAELYRLRTLPTPESLETALSVLKRDDFDSVSGALHFVATMNASRALARRTFFEEAIAPSIAIPEQVRGDFLRVLNELALNAVRHSDLGKQERRVRLEAVQEPRDDQREMLLVSVVDNGEGIADVPRLLASPLRKEGVRTGLAIVQEIAARRGWTLALQSKAGEGTTARVGVDLAAWRKMRGSGGIGGFAENGQGETAGPAGNAVVAGAAAMAAAPQSVFTTTSTLSLMAQAMTSSARFARR